MRSVNDPGLTIRGICSVASRAAIVSLGLVVAAAVQAQDREVHIGFKGGLSLPNLVGSSEEEITRDYKSRLAPNFGAFVDVGITRRASVQIGLDYAPQGGKREGVQPITSPLPGLPPPPGRYYFADFKNTAKLDYLEVPVLLKGRWRKEKPVGVFINGGPYFGFLLRARTVTSGSSTIYLDRNRTPLLLPPANQPLPPLPFDATTDVIDSLNRFNFGVTGGGGLTLPAGRNYVFVDVRASYGLTTLQRDTANDGKSRTGNLVVSLGYAFKVRGD